MASCPPRITADDILPGVYFLREDGTLWRCVAYADQPTATLERVDAGRGQDELEWLDVGKDVPLVPLRSFRSGPQRVGGVVGAPIFAGFVRLVPESE